MHRPASALVTGASGFIGRALVKRLLEQGTSVTCLLRKRESEKNREGLSAANIIETESLELSVLEATLDGLTVDSVFHLAAYGVRPSDQDPELLIDANVKYLANLLTVSKKWNLRRFVNTGSCSEYSASAALEGPLNEDAPCAPDTLYGASKAAGVAFGHVLATSCGVPLTTLRLFGVYGPGEGPARLIPSLIDKLSSGMPSPLTAGQQVRDLLYIDDVVNAFLHAASATSDSPSRIYNVASGTGTSIRQVAEWTADELGKPRSLLLFGELPYRHGEPMYLVGDHTRFTMETGWHPIVPLQQGLKRTIMARQHVASNYSTHD